MRANQGSTEAMNEVWRKVSSHDYEVSDLGRVRRLGRGDNKVLAPGLDSNGYPHVILYDHPFAWGKKVATLVAEAFLGPRPPGLQVNHKDGNKTNDRASNLEYVTNSENQIHAMRIGSANQSGPNAEDRAVIRLLVRNGFTQKYVGKLFGLHRVSIGRIVRRDRYAWEKANDPSPR